MVDNKVYIGSIFIDENRKIKQIYGGKGIEVSMLGDEFMLSIEDFKKSGLVASNLKLTDTSIIVPSEHYRENMIQYDTSNNLRGLYGNCFLTELYYETIVYTKMVTKIGIECNNKNILNKLIIAGAKLEKSPYTNKETVYIDEVTLCRLYRASSDIQAFLGHVEISYLSREDRLAILADAYRNRYRDKKVVMVEDTTYKERLETWIKKATILGIIDDYEIYLKGSKLLEYKGTNKCPVLPPVRCINGAAFCNNKYIKELVIPDTVRYIDCVVDDFESIEQIEIGENVGVISNKAFIYARNITELNLKNISEVTLTNNCKNLNKLKMNIGCKIKDDIFQPIVRTKVKEIEINLA